MTGCGKKIDRAQHDQEHFESFSASDLILNYSWMEKQLDRSNLKSHVIVRRLFCLVKNQGSLLKASGRGCQAY